jgi:hypothetical protein
MLYVLRSRRPGTSVTDVVLDAAGGRHGPRNLDPEDTRYQLIGEDFMRGLMDGETLHMMGENPKTPPPTPLQRDGRRFQVYISDVTLLDRNRTCQAF